MEWYTSYNTSIIKVWSMWNSTSPQMTTMIINNTSNLNEIEILSSSEPTVITKFRLVQDTIDNVKYIFLEAYYNLNVSNKVYTEILDDNSKVETMVYEATEENTGTVKFNVNVAKYNLNDTIGTLSSLTTTDKTSLVNALNELRTQTRKYTQGSVLFYTDALETKTFDAVMDLNFSTIFTMNDNANIKAGAGYPTGAYGYGLLITLISVSTYAKTQIYITDGVNETSSARGVYIRTRVGGTWTKLTLTENITTGTEFATNEFIDGKQVYRKRISFGALPNATTKNVAHGLTNVKFVDYNGIAYSSSGSTLKLPFVSTNSSAECIRLNTTTTNISIITGTDRSGFSECYVDLYYTKTN